MQSIGPPFDGVREIQHNNFSIKFDNKDNIISVEAITVRPNIIEKIEKCAIWEKKMLYSFYRRHYGKIHGLGYVCSMWIKYYNI